MWECATSVGPKVRKVHWRTLLPNFEPDSGRAPMGRREAPFAHVDTPSAMRKRKLRETAKPAFLTIESQVKVAQRLARKGVTNPAKIEILRRFRTRKVPTAMGDRVRFVRPGPRRNAVEGRGVVLCFPDKNKRFVAIDRSADQRKGKALSLIDVVPVEDAWCEQLRE